MNKQIVHDALILFAFTLVLGLILALVYGITKEPIAAANEKAAQEAYQAVYEEAKSFEQIAVNEATAQLVLDNGFKDTIDDVEAAKDASGNVVGYVITVTAKDGSQGSITFSVGITNEGSVNGFSITNTSETPGLGLKASEPEFSGQFKNKAVEKFEVVKQAPSADNEIEAISGSTITSKAVANGCNAAILYFQTELKEGGNE